jgi:hypothetical protein
VARFRLLRRRRSLVAAIVAPGRAPGQRTACPMMARRLPWRQWSRRDTQRKQETMTVYMTAPVASLGSEIRPGRSASAMALCGQKTFTSADARLPGIHRCMIRQTPRRP